jgi:hypothetical protein
MAVLLNEVTSNSIPASATGTATADSTRQLIEIPNTSVFDGATVTIQASSVNTAGLFSGIDRIATLTSAGNGPIIELPIGHFVRAIVNNVGALTNITCNMLPVE